MRSRILSVSSLLTISRLGKSGLKVSKVILGCMSYGSSKWQPWILSSPSSQILEAMSVLMHYR